MAKKAKPQDDSASAADSNTSQPFEESLGELQGIVNRLEDGSLPLDESMEQFERGIKLLKDCYRVLENAEQQIEILTRIDSNGEPHSEPFDASATFDADSGNEPKTKSDKLF